LRDIFQFTLKLSVYMQTVSLLVHLTDRTVSIVRFVLSIKCEVVCGNWKMLRAYREHLLVDMITVLIISHYCYSLTKSVI